MNPNRRWIAVAFFALGMLLWVLIAKFSAWMLALFGVPQWDLQLLGEAFTLTTLVGLLVSGFVTITTYRSPKISTLSGEVVVELKKVTWPTASETRGATVVVIITVFIMAVLLGLFDLFWSKFLNLFYPTIQSG